MTTQCTSTQMEFQSFGRRSVVGRFDGGRLTSDAGGVLLREVNRQLDLLPRMAACFTDHRHAGMIEHTLTELFAQRLYGLALGYEYLNDHDALRAGSVTELARIIGQIRQRWPDVRIIIRGDSGFCREEIMGWCEANGVGYLLGLARNQRLEKRIAKALRKSRPISGAGRPGRLPDRPRPPVCLTLCDADNSAAGLARPDNGAGPETSGPYLTDYCVCPLHRPT